MVKPSTAKHEAEVRFLTDDEGREILDCAARRYLKLSGEEFVRAWEAEEFEDPDASEAQRVAMRLPFAR